MVDADVFDTPGSFVTLELAASDTADTQLDLVRLALDGIFLFGEGLCAPLAIDLAVACCEPETLYPLSDSEPETPFLLLCRRPLPPGVGVEPAWVDQRMETVDELSSVTVQKWLSGLLEQGCPGGDVVCWSELGVRATRVRLPPHFDRLRDNTLHVRLRGGRADYPVERDEDGLWVSGPRRPTTLNAPLEIRVKNEAGLLTFALSIYWSVWADKHGPGREMIDTALARMRDREWSLPGRED
jgi:hypothetical protein